MRRTGTFSFFASLGIHGMLVGAVLLCIGEKNSTPPRIHLVYGEVGVENSGGIMAKTGEENAPAVQIEPVVQSSDSTEALDAQLMGGSASALPSDGGQLATPLLLTADGASGAIFGSGNSQVTPAFHYSAPAFTSGASQGARGSEGSSSGRTGIASGTDFTSIPQPVYPKESKRRGEQGTVLLEVEVKADGSIGEIKILQHPGHQRLIAAAIDAIKRARIDPATEDGRPIASTVRVPFNFVLR